MKRLSWMVKPIRSKEGVTIILVTVLLIGLLALAALAVDVGHIVIVRNELQNAADAGALAGAQFLYLENGTAVNPGANQIAYDAAILNRSDKIAVNVNWTGGNTGDVQRGHWSFVSRTFTPNDSTDPVELWNVTAEELDANPDFINAVRVWARRESPAATSFIARILGIQNFVLRAEAVAYIGFAGMLQPLDADQPIAICKQSILGWGGSGSYTCQFGRMINSGQNSATHQTGGWTNFSQPCVTASNNTVRPLVCADGNPDPLQLGQGMGTTGGELQNSFDRFINCWKSGRNDLNNDGVRESPVDTDNDGWPDQPWALTLPVIDCPGNNTGNCSRLMGAVTVNVIWVTRNDKNAYNEAPRKMADWTCDPPGSTTVSPGQICWQRFRDHFNLSDVSTNAPLTYEDKTIYFIPDCTPHEIMGTTGGENFGILARIPVLVNPVISQ